MVRHIGTVPANGPLVEKDILCIFDVENRNVGGIKLPLGIDIQPQVVIAAGNLLDSALAHLELEVIEIDILQLGLLIGDHHYGVLSDASDIVEIDVADDSQLLFLGDEHHRRHVDRLTLAPPVARMQTCFDPNIRKSHVFQRAGIADRNIDTAIRIENRDIRKIVIRHRILVVAADADTARRDWRMQFETLMLVDGLRMSLNPGSP